MNKHAEACYAYKLHFIDKNRYGFCEICSRSDKPLDTHHIIRASEAPKHKYLHDFRNLILVCRDCHNGFHANSIDRSILIEKRGLKELFDL